MRQQQREFHRERNRLLVTAIIRHLPISCLRIKNGVEGKLGQTRLNISRSGSTVASKYVSPVSLSVDEQILLSQLHQGVANRSIAMRVELHGVAHDVSHLVVASVVHTLHRVQYTALHRLQTILDTWHRTFKNNVRSIVEKPVLIHATKMVNGRGIKPVYRLVVRMLFRGLVHVVVFYCSLVFDIVVHIAVGNFKVTVIFPPHESTERD